MKNHIEFFAPVKVVCGDNVIKSHLKNLAVGIGCKRILIISGPVLNKLGVCDFVASIFDDDCAGVVQKYTNVPNDSSLQTIEEICSLYKSSGADSIIAIGGGSVIDTAKAVKLGLSQNQSKIDGLFGYNMSKIGVKIPFIVIPTTCGTGSEVTKVAVISDENKDTKEEIISDILLPDIAVLDPNMLKTLPKKSILLTSFDALSHAIEGYIGKGKNTLSDSCSKYAIRGIVKNLSSAMSADATDSVYLDMLKASCYAGISFSNSMVGGVHAIAHSVGSVLSVGHDFAIATLLPIVLKYFIHDCYKDYSKLFDLIQDVCTFDECDFDKVQFFQPAQPVQTNCKKSKKKNEENIDIEQFEKAKKFVYMIWSLLQKNLSKIGGIPTFSECGMDKNKCEQIVKLSLSDGAILTSPRILEYDDVVEILRLAEEKGL